MPSALEKLEQYDGPNLVITNFQPMWKLHALKNSLAVKVIAPIDAHLHTQLRYDLVIFDRVEPNKNIVQNCKEWVRLK